LLLPLVFAYIYLSQGSVETHLPCGGIYNNLIIANADQRCAPPTSSRVPAGVSLPAFATMTMDDVITAVRRLPDKSSAADRLPIAVLKQAIGLLSPVTVCD